jgi:molybdopterin-guanine dinucleotide biosynthesis protein A
VGELTTFILAGGKSSRMGQDKAFMKLAGRPLIDYAIDQARAMGSGYFVVGPAEKFGSFARTVSDIYPDAGPLGGIHAALHHGATELNLVLPVDTPFLTPKFLLMLVDTARSNRCTVTVARTISGLHPLCGIYRREFLPLAEAALKAGRFKLDAAFPPESTCVVDIEKYGHDPAMLDNVNTPEELERAERRLRAEAD